MSDFTKIAKQMREDWNRRIQHDYRFWMTESHSDDVSMWSSGERDSAILLDGIEEKENKTLLELGCGVGRLLKANVGKFHKVIGFDVSEEAVKRARELIGPDSSLELHAGDGFSLNPIPDNSVDVAFSFAAITSMPVDVAANYLKEMHRVLKSDGTVRLQMYLGEEMLVGSEDTLHLRSFKRENLQLALEVAGFQIEYIKELVLPFQVSFKEMGFEAVIVSLKKGEAIPGSRELISQALLPGGEIKDNKTASGAEIECWMSLNYAQELAEKGNFEKAHQTLEYALSFARSTTIDIRDLLDKVVSTIEEGEKKAKAAPPSPQAKPVHGPAPKDPIAFENNLRVLEERFPEIAQKVKAPNSSSAKIEARSSSQGAVIFFEDVCLDHPDKPKAAGDNWAKRLMDELRVREAKELAIYGFASGYHVESLLTQTSKPVSVLEPSLDVFRIALGSRDLSGILSKIKRLDVGVDDKHEWLDGGFELLVRPQTQSVFASEYASLKSSFYGKRALSMFRPSIAVIGPMQGGTLPIMGYCARALLSLGQRTRALDMSSFVSGYHSLDKFVFDKMRRGGIEGTYVEMMSQVALEAFNEKPVDIVICMAQAPMSGRVLAELRKRGVITVLWFVEDYLRFTYWKDIAQYYDFVFTIQKGECIELITKAGAGNVHYLPVACDPIVHAPAVLTEEERARWGSPVSFVGAGYHNRQQVMASLCELPLKLWGTEWPDCKPFDRLLQESGRRLTPDEYIKIFNSTDVNLNLHSSAERDGVDPFGDFVNPRTFELASTNAFQLVDERALLPEVFEPGKEVATFKDVPELKAKIEYYLAHPEERKIMTAKARERVLREHTYAHRLQEMLTIIYSRCYERLKERSDNNPWKKMLGRAKSHPELSERCEQAFQRGEEPSLDALISDIVSGNGKLSDTEKKLLFLFHIRKQIIRIRIEEGV